MRPLINYLIVYAPDADERRVLHERYVGHPDFASVSEPTSGWLVATSPLPLSEPIDRHTRHGWLGASDGGELIGDHERFASDLRDRPETMAAHDGDISAVLLTESDLTVMRSPSGLVPWYVHRAEDGLIAVSTRLAYFPRHVPRPFPIDAFAHALATDGISCIGRRSPLSGVSTVPVGHVLSVGLDGGQRLLDYWGPQDLTPTRRGPDDAVQRGRMLRSVLIERLQADLDPAATSLIGLSGGVDSSCLGALAVGPAGRSLDAFTFLPGEDHPALAEVDTFVRSIADLVQPTAHWRFHLDEQGSLAATPKSPAVGLPVPHPALAHLPAMKADGDFVVYTGGEAADDLFAGPFVLGKDWVENVSAGQIVRALRKPWYGVARRFVAQEWWDARRGVRALPLPVDDDPYGVFLPEIQEEYREWIRGLRRRLEASAHPFRHLLLFFEFDGWLRQNWEVCSELGVRRSFPFWCRETIELALGAHPRHHALPPKRIIRSGMAGDVPALNLNRPDKGAWSEKPLVTWPGGALPERLSSMVRPELIGTTPGVIEFGDADLLMGLVASTRPVT